MSAPGGCRLIGCWRIVEADLWDREHLDLCGPAMMTIGDEGHGEIAFGALQAGLDLEYSRSLVFFTWAGFEELDEANGTGNAELLDDGSLEIEFNYHLGDEAILKAVRETSSTACYMGQFGPPKAAFLRPLDFVAARSKVNETMARAEPRQHPRPCGAVNA